MPFSRSATLVCFALAAASANASAAETPIPAALAAPGETVVLSVHAEGAQVYECKAGADGKPMWSFREPIATLLLDGKTVGRAELGTQRRQRRGRKGLRQRPRHDRKRYPVAQARHHLAARQRHPCRCHDRTADQHQGRQA